MDIKLTKYTGKIKLYPNLTNQMDVKTSIISRSVYYEVIITHL